jgi:DNA-binding NarL/FixJ family response regulator
MARRTVKAHFNRLFLRFGITSGIKRQTRDTLSEATMVGAERYGTRQPNPREKRVIELVAQGLKNKEVADEIGTTEHVVKNYLRVIYDKLGLWNRVELALWYEARQFEQAVSF